MGPYGLTLWQSWILVKFKIIQIFAPLFRSDYPTNVRFYSVTSAQLVTFKYRGKAYRGHLLPYCRLDLCKLSTRCSMKRPTRAVDGRGQDVTSRVREFWGPSGNWNREMGLQFCPQLDAEIHLPLNVKFNDLTYSTFE